jgi:alpha-beta hydrolase superfamily lysophospholipase
VTLLLSLGYALIGAFALCFFVWMHVAFWRAFYRVERAADEVHVVRCADGWPVALYRYRPAVGAARAAAPVLLCHGLGATAANLDLCPGASLARYLRGLGFEVWALELRGAGALTRPRPFGGRSWEIFFDDFVDQDAPAAIAHALAQSGASRVHWVGHSMGGLIGLAVAQGPLAEAVASVTALGAPARLRPAAPVRAALGLVWLVSWLPFLPTRWLGALAAPLYFDSALTVPFFNRAHRSARLIRRALANMVGDIPTSLLRQFARWAANGEVTAWGDERNFTQGLVQVRAPLLAIAGEDDLLAPPPTARAAVEQASAERRAWLNLGGDGEGASALAYGHGDLLVGARAILDVYPRVASWIAAAEGQEISAEDAQAVLQAERAAAAALLHSGRRARRAPSPSPPSPSPEHIPLPPPPRPGAAAAAADPLPVDDPALSDLEAAPLYGGAEVAAEAPVEVVVEAPEEDEEEALWEAPEVLLPLASARQAAEARAASSGARWRPRRLRRAAEEEEREDEVAEPVSAGGRRDE